MKYCSRNQRHRRLPQQSRPRIMLGAIRLHWQSQNLKKNENQGILDVRYVPQIRQQAQTVVRVLMKHTILSWDVIVVILAKRMMISVTPTLTPYVKTLKTWSSDWLPLVSPMFLLLKDIIMFMVSCLYRVYTCMTEHEDDCEPVNTWSVLYVPTVL